MTTDDMFAIDTSQPTKSRLRGQDHALSDEEKLEAGLEDSMDASDPPAVTAPGDHGDPVPSSGFTEEEDKKE